MAANESAVLVRLRLLGAQVFSTEAKTAAGSLDTVGVAGKRAEAGIRRVGSAATTIAPALRKLGLGIAGIATVGLYEVGKQTIQFDRQMRNVNSIAQLSEGRFQALSKQVLALAGPTAQAPATLAAGLYDIVSAGYAGTKALGILKAGAYAATAGLSTASIATNAIITALQAYRLPASQAKHISDLLFETVNRGVITFPELAQGIGSVLPFANSLGIGLSQVGAQISTMTKEGLSGDEAITRIRQTIVSLLKPSSDLKKAFLELGVTGGDDLIKKYGGLQGALEAVVGTTNGTKSAIAALFPNVRAEGGVFALTGKNIRAAHDDLRAFKDVHGATARALAQQSKSISYQWQRLRAQVVLAIRIGSKLIPVASKALGFVSQIVTGRGTVGTPISQFLSGLASGASPKLPPTQTTQGLRGAAAIPASGAQTAGARVYDVLAKAWAKMKDVARSVFPAVAKYITGLFTALKPAAPFLTNVVLPLLKGLATGFGATLLLSLKLLTPIVHDAAVALGAIGKALAPIAGPLKIVGIGFGILFAPRILAGFALLPKIGGAFKLLALPLRGVLGVTKLVPGFAKGISAGALSLGRFVGTMTPSIGRSMVLALTNTVGRITNVVSGLGSSLTGLAGSGGKLALAGKAIGSRIASAIALAIKLAGPLGIAAAVVGLALVIKGPLNKLSADIFKWTGGILGGGVSSNGAAVTLAQADAHARALVAKGGGILSYQDAIQGIKATGAVKNAPAGGAGNRRATMMMAAPSTVWAEVHLHIGDKDRVELHKLVTKHERRLQEAR